MEQFMKNIQELDSILPRYLTVQYSVVHDGPADIQTDVFFELAIDLYKDLRFISYHKNKGKGYALRRGVQEAQTPYVITIDFDFPYEKENVLELINCLLKGNDVVVGKRSARYFNSLPFKRKLISRAYSFMNRLFLELPLFDTQSGIKGFNKEGRSVFLQTTINRFLIDTEFILRAHKQNLSIKVINIELRPGIRFSDFGIKVIKTEFVNFIYLVWLNLKLNRPQARVFNTAVVETVSFETEYYKAV
jgi:glycosyltransferase involved in cell wall biosynthesis